MPEYKDEFDLKLPLIDVLSACHKAADSLAWKLVKQTETSLSYKEPFRFGSTYGVQIKIDLTPRSVGVTTVTLTSAIGGLGAAQSQHLQKQMALFRSRLEIATNTKAAPRACPKCHKELPEGAEFCPKCGTPIATEHAAASTTAGSRVPKPRRFGLVVRLVVGFIFLVVFVLALTQKSWAPMSAIYIILGTIALFAGFAVFLVSVFRKKRLKPSVWVMLCGFLFILMGSVVAGVNPLGKDKEDTGGPKVLEKTTAVVKANQGAKLTLSDGSSASIPAGLAQRDTKMTMARLAQSPSQIPNKDVATVGPAISVSFDPSLSPTSWLPDFLRFERPVFAASPQPLRVQIVAPLPDDQTKLNGSVPFADIAQRDGTHQIVGLESKIDPKAKIETVNIPILSPTDAKMVTLGHAQLKPGTAADDPTCGGKTWNGTQWGNGIAGIKPAKRTLVMVHGMMSDVEQAYGCNGIKRRYDQVVGFNYNWTQGLEESGQQLAAFLDQLKSAGITEVDIEAHSEGVPVSLSAYTKTSMPVRNLFLLGGPIMGTPASTRASLAQAGSEYIKEKFPSDSPLLTMMLTWAGKHPFALLHGTGNLTLNQVLQGRFADDLQPESKTLSDIRNAVTKKIRSGQQTKIVAVAGTNMNSSKDMQDLGNLLLKTYAFAQGDKFDGIIGLNSAWGMTPDGKESGLPISRRVQAPVSHTDLACDPSVNEELAKELAPSPPVTVTPTPKVVSLELQPSSATIEVGKNFLFRAVARDAGGNILELPASAFSWATSNPSIAVVDKSGFVDGISPGTTAVAAAIGPVAGGAMVRVISSGATPIVTPVPNLPSKPDLTVSSVTFTPASGKTGQSLSVNFTVKNQGGVDAGSFTARISFATTKYGTDLALTHATYPSTLAPGASQSFQLGPITIPTTISAGTYWVTVYADSARKIDEADENNNIGSSDPAKFALSVTPTPIPTATARPQPVTGVWKGQAILSTGITGATCRFGGDITVNFVQNGTSLSGTITYDLGADPSNSPVRCPATRIYGTAPLSGTIKGDRNGGALRFSFTTAAPFSGFTINADGLAMFGAFIEGSFSGDATGDYHIEPR